MAAYYTRLIKEGRKYATITGKGRRGTVLKLGKWRALVTTLISMYFLLALGLPLLVLLYYSLIPLESGFVPRGGCSGRHARRDRASTNVHDA